VQQYWKINSNRGKSIGRYPVPSSMHAGIVNMSFCDGSAKGVADTIDLRIYGSLLTPQGVRYGELPTEGCGY
jgi:prepilin-type processing-associated H-X9-DG protein